MPMEDFALLVGAIASALSLVATGVVVLRHGRQRILRSRLEVQLGRLLRLDKRFVALATETDRLLSEGVGWFGIAILPPKLRGHVGYLEAQIDELERAKAQVRALPTQGANDRLRETVETVIDNLRTACAVYRDGIWAAYRESSGEAIPPGATGRDPLAALGKSHERLRAMRLDMEFAVRTATYQLGVESLAESYECRWPTIRGELPHGVDLWGAEPRPISHEGLES